MGQYEYERSALPGCASCGAAHRGLHRKAKPDETIDAFADHGLAEAPTIEADLEEAQQVFGDIEKVGVNFDCVAWQLENEGVRKVIDSSDQSMRTLADKRQQFLSAHARHQVIAQGS